jgi:hypothetical protein
MAKERVPFVVKDFFDESNHLCKGLFIDGQHFDWGIDEESFKEAMAMGPQYVRILQADIQKHFIESLSEFMNRKVTPLEVNEAQKTGWIEK